MPVPKSFSVLASFNEDVLKAFLKDFDQLSLKIPSTS